MKHSRLLAAAFLFVPALLLAQAQGRVKGIVTDTGGKPIAGATITVTCAELTTFKKTTTTDKRGEFSVLFVDATKRYKFLIEAKGFQAIEKMEKPLIGHQTLDVTYQLKSAAEADAEQQQSQLVQPGYKELGEAKELLDAGKNDEARVKLREAAAAKPDLYIAWHQIARLDYDDKKWADALANAEKCLAIKADDTPCLAIALNSAKEAGNEPAYEKYLALYKSANPEDPGLLFNEAAGYLNKGDDASAKPLLEKILQVDPNHADALFQLGMVYLRAGDNAKAKETLLQFLKVAPDHKEAPTATEMLKYL